MCTASCKTHIVKTIMREEAVCVEVLRRRYVQGAGQKEAASDTRHMTQCSRAGAECSGKGNGTAVRNIQTVFM